MASRRDELPVLEISMAFHVLLPRALRGRLERKNQNPSPLHLPGELIGSKRFPEAHLRVPEKVRWFLFVPLFFPPRGEIGRRLLDCLFLFGPHPEIEVAVCHMRL